jgi:hypothetical protein
MDNEWVERSHRFEAMASLGDWAYKGTILSNQ